ncbi:MAG: hypothetical protein HEQ23_07055 [Tepidisphaera sp.]
MDVSSIKRSGRSILIEFTAHSTSRNADLVCRVELCKAMASGGRQFAATQLVLGPAGQDKSYLLLLKDDKIEGRMRIDDVPDDVASLTALVIEFTNLRFSWQQSIPIQ